MEASSSERPNESFQPLHTLIKTYANGISQPMNTFSKNLKSQRNGLKQPSDEQQIKISNSNIAK